MDIKPINNSRDYKSALLTIESLMDARANTPEGDQLDVLTTLVEAWEHKHFPMDLPDAVEAIKFEMEQRNLTVKDLEPMIGKANRVYEVLNRTRPLTLKMICRLHQQLKIPAEVLLRQGDKNAVAEDVHAGRRYSVGTTVKKGKRKVRYVETNDPKKGCRFL